MSTKTKQKTVKPQSSKSVFFEPEQLKEIDDYRNHFKKTHMVNLSFTDCVCHLVGIALNKAKVYEKD